MRLYEFEAKQVLAKHRIPVAEGKVAHSAAEAEAAAKELGGSVVLKAQVLAPGLLKSGSVESAKSAAEAGKKAAQLLELDDGGRKPNGVLVQKKVDAEAEYSLAVTYDGTAKKPVMIAATSAGDVEEIAEDRVMRRHFSALFPFSSYTAKELVSSLGCTGSELNRLTGIVARLATLFLDYDLTQANISSLARLADGSFTAVDAYMDMEVEGRERQGALLSELGVKDDDTRAVREPTQFEIAGKKIDDDDPRGIVGPVVEFDGNIGLVIGAGGGSLTLTDAVRRAGGKPANYAAIGGNPSVGKAIELTKLVLNKPGVEKIAVMSNVVSNTRADLVARGVIKGVLELGFEPADKIAVFRVPGAWEADAVKILEKYGVDYCDRTVSISEAAKRAVEKIGK